MGKKSLYTLLGTNCLLAGRGGADYKSKQEGVAIRLCSAVLQNLSLNPGNRTRFYKAELRGSAALGKQLWLPCSSDEHAIHQVQTESAIESPSCSSKPKVGLVLEASNTTGATCRPKVIFPPILEDEASGLPPSPPINQGKEGVKEVLAGTVAFCLVKHSNFKLSQ